MKIRPAKRLRGRASVPGDKSISHRAGLIAALARGRTRIENFSTSADCDSTLGVLLALGVHVERANRRDGSLLVVEGAGADEGAARLRTPSGALDCGNSGTTMRLVAGVLAAQEFASVLAGDESLSRRPMRRIAEPLELMGARVSSVEGHAPLRVEGRRPLKAIEYETAVASAQVKSCVLLAGLGADGRTTVSERAPTRDHTERMLRWFGVEVETRSREEGSAEVFSASVVGPARFGARDFSVPGDISSAAFLLVAAALLPGSDLTVEGVGLNPTRAEIVSTLRRLGADVRVEDASERCNEAVGDVRVNGAGALVPRVEDEGARQTNGDKGASISRVKADSDSGNANVLRGAVVASLIDELPVLAVAGTRVEGGLEIRDARELRVKESDRVSATVENLRAMGAEVEEFDDGLRVFGPSKLRGARLRSFGDHRIAMAFAVAALTAEGDTFIDGAEECVRISFPEFFPLLESLVER
ncbi:MAG TPA: 3-phosphoshikimate 1-carboxyvinyltransferase [Pyrinomonadaceae bacterium]|nr:3-phosphoshikimate 1-carboxyvinyltransferase [Pyrinomonadaceae bacterium]